MAKKIKDENGKVYVQKEPFYKKWWFILIVVLIVVSPFYKNKSDSSDSAATSASSTVEVKVSEENKPSSTTETKVTTETSESSKEEVKELPAPSKKANGKIGEPLKVGDVEYTVTSKSLATNVGGEWGKTANGQYVVVDVTVKNVGKKTITVTDGFFKLLQKDVTFESDSTASIYAQEGDGSKFFLNELNPGNTVSGKVVFDVSPETANAGDLQLQVQTGYWGTQKGIIDLQ